MSPPSAVNASAQSPGPPSGSSAPSRERGSDSGSRWPRAASFLRGFRCYGWHAACPTTRAEERAERRASAAGEKSG